jgi:sugar phosphate isomerase/epimerase
MAEFIDAAHHIGFSMVEANYQLTKPMLSEIIELRDRGKVMISSVHDPGVLPDGVALRELPQLSALDETERNWAVELAKGAVDIAVRLGAGAVVVHPGRVEGLDQAERQYRDLIMRGETNREEFPRLAAYLVEERAARREPHIAALRRSLEDLALHAQRQRIRIGLENRYYYSEIPLIDEALELVTQFEPYGIGFWYDVGHAHALAVMGLVEETEWLQTLSRKVIGTHLHDARGLTDHLVPGAGEIDLMAIQANLPADALRVCELGAFNSEQEIQAGFNHLRQLGYF